MRWWFISLNTRAQVCVCVVEKMILTLRVRVRVIHQPGFRLRGKRNLVVDDGFSDWSRRICLRIVNDRVRDRRSRSIFGG